MPILEAALKKEGLRLAGDVLPKGQRTQKDFKRLIAAVRAAEGGVMQRLGDAERELNKALQKNLELHHENEKLKAALLQHRLRDHMETVSSLTISDKTKLLEVASVSNGS